MKSSSLCIGILGGGQLARMSAYAAHRLGIDIAILEKEKNSPAGKLTHLEFVGSVSSDALLRKFSNACDVVTLENEFIDSRRLEFLERAGQKVVPTSATIARIQDKYLQKQSLLLAGLPVPEFVAVEHKNDFQRIADRVGLPFVLKSRKMGYDGYGNAIVTGRKSFDKSFTDLTARHSQLYAEMFIDFHMELAVMVVRTKRETRSYPVVQTIQKDHICHSVIAPAQISRRERSEAVEIAVEAVKAVRGYGIFGIELFLAKDGSILINEMAPRPHNSGHYTIEGCVTSQFENHVRAAMNLPLGSTEMTAPFAVMINLLGKKSPKTRAHNLALSLQDSDAHLHLYGKDVSRKGRKMGHITLLGDSLPPLLRRVHRLESQLSI